MFCDFDIIHNNIKMYIEKIEIDEKIKLNIAIVFGIIVFCVVIQCYLNVITKLDKIIVQNSDIIINLNNIKNNQSELNEVLSDDEFENEIIEPMKIKLKKSNEQCHAIKPNNERCKQMGKENQKGGKIIDGYCGFHKNTRKNQ